MLPTWMLDASICAAMTLGPPRVTIAVLARTAAAKDGAEAWRKPMQANATFHEGAPAIDVFSFSSRDVSRGTCPAVADSTASSSREGASIVTIGAGRTKKVLSRLRVIPAMSRATGRHSPVVAG